MTFDDAASALLAKGLAELGITGPEGLAPRLLSFGEFVLAENERTNLVGRHSLSDLVVKDILDSLAPLAHRRIAGPVVDIGSGAGFPGVPIAMAFAEVRVTMLEPRTKRAEFLRSAIQRFDLANASCLRKTAHAVALESNKERAHMATARAVGAPLMAIELALPLINDGGTLLLYRGRDAAPDRETQRRAARLGAVLQEASEVHVPYLEGARHAWWFSKSRPAAPKNRSRRRLTGRR